MAKKIRWGFIGTGWIADKMADALSVVDDAELAAVGSRTKEKAADFARRYHVPAAYGSYEELAADPSIDAVYVATPHPFHCANTLLCLRNGKAVLCEKPFAMNEREVVQMISAARKHNVFLMEAFWTRFLPSIERVIGMIAAGTLGEVRHIHSDHAAFRVFDPNHRAFNKSLGGGSLLDIGIYPVFLTLLLWGEPDRIEAVPHIGSTGVDESLALTFKYNDGRIATLFSSFVVDSTVETHICGTDGRLKIHRWWFCPVPIELAKGNDKPVTIDFKYVGNGYNYEVEEVHRCLRAGKKESDVLSLDFSLRLIRLLDRIRQQIGLTYDADLKSPSSQTNARP
ncbi:MAG TPA: Gfo/Idh/MocA family oxidoreductase [Bacteroidota bacterium]|nr:Gfo/Idh/MocA family oxidoreductase [Bacteroidota bacterium]